MPYVIVNNQKTYYTQNKIKSDAPTLVLIHGAGGRIQGWPYPWQQTTFVRSATARRWLTDFPLYMLDLPGHGRSAPPSRNSIEEYAQDVIDFMTALDLHNVVVVGHSMGGAIAQAIGAQSPVNLAALILIGTGARLPVSDVILDGLLTEFSKTVAMIMKFSWHKQAAPMFKQVALQHMLSTDPAVVHGDFLACHRFDMRDQLANITVPTLVIGGTADRMMPLDYSQFLMEHIPNATLATIEDAGHFMTVEKTSQVTKVMVNFLNHLTEQT